jgi:hypothetical protein
MVRIGICSLLILFISCSTKNEYGYSRISPSRFNIRSKNNFETYKFIDTNSFYRLDQKIYKNATGSIVDQYYKFFSQGRVGLYYQNSYELEKTQILESKKGVMGFFTRDGNNIIAQFYYTSWHGNGFKTDTLQINNNTLVRMQNHLDGSIKSVFVKEVINPKIKITNPDW